MNLSKIILVTGLTLSGITVSSVFTPAIAFSLNDDLQGYWQFNGNGNDSSENGRNLDIFGDAGFGTGLINQALSLNRDPNQYAERPTNDSVFNFNSNDFSIQVWINFNATEGEQTLIEKFKNGDGPGWTLTKLPYNAFRFGACTGEITCTPTGGPFAFDTAILPIFTGTFHQIIIRRKENIFNIFFDGNVVGSDVFTGIVPSTTNPLLVGRRDGGQEFPVNGLIDEVAIWNRAISDTDIKYLYNNGKGNTISTPVPEPLTILGSGIALGFGGFLKRKLGKHQKDEK